MLILIQLLVFHCIITIIQTNLDHQLAQPIQEVLHTAAAATVLKRKVETVPYQWYDINVKALRIGKQMHPQLFSSIIVRCGSTFTKSIDKCVARTPSERCTFHDCSIDNDESSFSNQLVSCPEGGLDIEMKLKKDLEPTTCEWKNEKAMVVTKISLYPFQGR